MVTVGPERGSGMFARYGGGGGGEGASGSLSTWRTSAGRFLTAEEVSFGERCCRKNSSASRKAARTSSSDSRGHVPRAEPRSSLLAAPSSNGMSSSRIEAFPSSSTFGRLADSRYVPFFSRRKNSWTVRLSAVSLDDGDGGHPRSMMAMMEIENGEGCLAS